ncbi:hypothetical protein SLEP1_g47710 [Rubroshorea leprosula]|uniref:Uncharacterized protein n=1 Tax=Rubroshorea leprosula TaxID=152421 RepID=A0AAV5LRE2_9ROSI|nr:hypothetical protein SLEP1_g47710 [Rubroshorea leprosula]
MLYYEIVVAVVAGKDHHGQDANLATNSAFADKVEFLGVKG